MRHLTALRSGALWVSRALALVGLLSLAGSAPVAHAGPSQATRRAPPAPEPKTDEKAAPADEVVEEAPAAAPKKVPPAPKVATVPSKEEALKLESVLIQSLTATGTVEDLFGPGSLCTPEAPCDVLYDTIEDNSGVMGVVGGVEGGAFTGFEGGVEGGVMGGESDWVVGGVVGGTVGGIGVGGSPTGIGGGGAMDEVNLIGTLAPEEAVTDCPPDMICKVLTSADAPVEEPKPKKKPKAKKPKSPK